MTVIQQVPWPIWCAIVVLSLVLGVLLGQILHEQRRVRLAAISFLAAALFLFTVSTWR